MDVRGNEYVLRRMFTNFDVHDVQLRKNSLQNILARSGSGKIDVMKPNRPIVRRLHGVASKILGKNTVTSAPSGLLSQLAPGTDRSTSNQAKPVHTRLTSLLVVDDSKRVNAMAASGLCHTGASFKGLTRGALYR